MCTDAAHHINYLDPLAGNLSVTAFWKSLKCMSKYSQISLAQ
jgi:hypothetical protein